MAGGSAALAINPHLYPKIGYNTLRDFAPVTQIVDIAEVFVVNPSVPAHNLTDYVRLAKKHPGELNYGSSGAGSTSHLVTAALAAREVGEIRRDARVVRGPVVLVETDARDLKREVVAHGNAGLGQ